MSGKTKKDLYAGAVGVSNYRISQPVGLTGWKYGACVTVLIGSIGLALWPIAIDPILHVNKYKIAHKEIQAELEQVGLMPGQLKKWEDPWKRGK